MARPTLFKSLAAVTFLAASLTGLVNAHAEGCQCSPETQRVTYLVVEMPAQPAVPVIAAATPAEEEEETPALPEPTRTPVPFPEHPAEEHTFGPCNPPDFDTKDPANFIPKPNVTLYYAGSDGEQQAGSINMTLALNNPAVVLEEIEAVSSVVCGDDNLTVTFADDEAFKEALADWDVEGGGFILITNHLGNCDAEFERGFFIATNVTSDAEKLSITVDSVKEELGAIAGECEMYFTSMPAATLTKRLVLDPKYSFSFGESLPENTVLYSDGKYVKITADEAYFSSTVTFSGYLNYNFWGFKLKDLYFDIDTQFEAAVGLSADVKAEFAKQVRYAPDELSYSVINVPGIVSLGPGLGFAVGVDFDVSAAVGIEVGAGISLPHGNVHVDFLDGKKTGATGWEPKYTSYANITQAADVHVDASVDVTVELALKLLGGLIDLSSGITATPGFDSTFRLRGEQNLGVNGTIGANSTANPTVDIPKEVECAQGNGVEFTSDFYFNLTGFATKWWRGDIWKTRVPLWDVCYHF